MSLLWHRVSGSLFTKPLATRVKAEAFASSEESSEILWTHTLQHQQGRVYCRASGWAKQVIALWSCCFYFPRRQNGWHCYLQLQLLDKQPHGERKSLLQSRPIASEHASSHSLPEEETCSTTKGGLSHTWVSQQSLAEWPFPVNLLEKP